MIRFAHNEVLFVLVLLPFLIFLFWWANRKRRRLLAGFGNPQLLQNLIPMLGAYKRTVKFVILLFAILFVILGIANPQIGTKMEEVKREGVDIMIALDVSNSMKAEDIKPNRLESAKQELARMLDKLQNDRIGLVVFGGDSYLQLPLTADYSAAKLILGTIDVDVVPVPGTAIGSALRLSMKSFLSEEKKYKVVILITDGENHEDDAVTAAKEAHAEGVIVHAIGMGLPEGAPIPLYQNNTQVGFKKDGNGSIVLTKLDESGLKEIAETGGGKYMRASNQQSEIDAIFKEIETMEKKEFGTKMFTEYEDRFQFLLAPAILLIVLELFISERKTLWFSRWKFLKRTS